MQVHKEMNTLPALTTQQTMGRILTQEPLLVPSATIMYLSRAAVVTTTPAAAVTVAVIQTPPSRLQALAPPWLPHMCLQSATIAVVTLWAASTARTLTTPVTFYLNTPVVLPAAFITTNLSMGQSQTLITCTTPTSLQLILTDPSITATFHITFLPFATLRPCSMGIQ